MSNATAEVITMCNGCEMTPCVCHCPDAVKPALVLPSEEVMQSIAASCKVSVDEVRDHYRSLGYK